jgi:hypothetical protein
LQSCKQAYSNATVYRATLPVFQQNNTHGHGSSKEDELIKKADFVFQDAVAMLLSLIGFSVIVLGKKKLKNKELDKLRLDSKVVVGSVDIIAFRENNKLFLIDCTLDIVDDSKIRKLQKIVNYFSSEEDRKYSKIMGLIFSSQDCRDVSRKSYEDIRIIDAHLLKIIFDLALKGKNQDARSRLHSFDYPRD